MKIINEFWDEYIDRMVGSLLDEGYTDSMIIYKVSDSLFNHKKMNVIPVTEEVIPVVQFEELPSPISIHDVDVNSLIPVGTGGDIVVKMCSDVACNTGFKHGKHQQKCLSDKFCGLGVFVEGRPDSLAEIVGGINNKSQDMFKVLDTDETLKLEDYMLKYVGASTDSGFSHRNPSKIRFIDNPSVSVKMVKNNWDQFNSFEDIVLYTRKHNK